VALCRDRLRAAESERTPSVQRSLQALHGTNNRTDKVVGKLLKGAKKSRRPIQGNFLIEVTQSETFLRSGRLTFQSAIGNGARFRSSKSADMSIARLHAAMMRTDRTSGTRRSRTWRGRWTDAGGDAPHPAHGRAQGQRRRIGR
jgi:hypothetical protein